ncbi:MAG: hypothetical protein ACRDRO_13290 [Pseudonocardiaceae bacterium]
MAGRHSKRPGTHAQIPSRWRAYTLGVTDAHSHVEHLVTDESLAANRHSGRFPAKCGTQVLAASLTDPGCGRCPECAR